MGIKVVAMKANPKSREPIISILLRKTIFIATIPQKK